MISLGSCCYNNNLSKCITCSPLSFPVTAVQKLTISVKILQSCGHIYTSTFSCTAVKVLLFIRPCAHTHIWNIIVVGNIKSRIKSVSKWSDSIHNVHCQLQITGNFQWARDQVATMQHSCVDDVLMANYSDVTDSSNLNTLVKNSVNDVVRYRCEPYDCNGHGRCVEGSCVCYPGMSLLSSSASSLWSLF